MSEQQRCGNCEKYLPIDPDGYYDREYPYSETSWTVVFCNEYCAQQKRGKDMVEFGPHTNTAIR